jgi:group I intron endonuclease
MINSGIYRILNTINGKGYVGSAKVFKNRWQRHITRLRKGTHHSILLQRAWNKYGETFFKFEILEVISNPTKKLLESREQYWIDYYDVVNPDKGYNILPIAGSRLGVNDLDIKKDKENILNFCIANGFLPYKRSSDPIAKRLGKRLEEFKRKTSSCYDEEFSKKINVYLTQRELKVFLDKKQLKDFIYKYGYIPSQISKDTIERKLGIIWFMYTWKNSDCYDSSLVEEFNKFPTWQQFKKLQKV